MEYAEVDASIVDHAEARLGLRVGAARKQEENGTVSKQHRRALLPHSRGGLTNVTFSDRGFDD